MTERYVQGVGNFAPFLPLSWLPWQHPLRNRKNWTGSRKFTQYLLFGEKIVKIGPVDTEIALLIVKKEKKKKEINASKIYSPVGKFAERTNYASILHRFRVIARFCRKWLILTHPTCICRSHSR